VNTVETVLTTLQREELVGDRTDLDRFFGNNNRVWYLETVIAIAAFVAAGFIQSTGVLFTFSMSDSGVLAILQGVLCTTLAFFLYRRVTNAFLTYLGLALSLCGLFWFLAGTHQLTDSHGSVVLVNGLLLGVLVFLRDPLLRFLWFLVFAVNLDFYLFIEQQFSWLALMVVAALGGTIYLLGTREGTEQRPLAYALALTAIGTAFSLGMLFAREEVATLPVQLGVFLVTGIFLFHLLGKREPKILACLLSGLAVVAALTSPAILVSLALMVLAFATREAVLLVLAVTALVAALIVYYYQMEVTLLEPQANGAWAALIKPLKKVQPGEEIVFSDALSATLVAKAAGQGLVRFNLSGEDFDAALNAAGAMPLPPYIEAKRPADAQDLEDYQTIWAKQTGAVAAPTASLHFDAALMAALAERGVEITYVTLHVGAGTFLPVKVDDVTTHKMHAEWGAVSDAAANAIAATKAAGHRVIPVGTTALRLIETAARDSGQIAPFEGETDIFIYPGFPFRVSDGLMTNFHLPKSTLMMLVSALMGRERILDLYAHAVRKNYRFFSYGDASLLLP